MGSVVWRREVFTRGHRWLCRVIAVSTFGCLILAGACKLRVPQTQALLLATTTSTDNSGLLGSILPHFEARTGVKVGVIAVGTGQALAMGERGDADILLVHAPVLEESFVAAGYGTERFEVMYNDFVIVGPTLDPADIKGYENAVGALVSIAATESPWVSRGDESGTHVRELKLWDAAGISPKASDNWYMSIGQGMGATLNFASETDSYTLSDRATFLALSDQLSHLTLLFGGKSIEHNPDPTLYNYYSVIPVSPKISGANNLGVALQFVSWVTSPETQEHISRFGIEQFGQPLFIPNMRR